MDDHGAVLMASLVEWHDFNMVEGVPGLTLNPACMPVASSTLASAPLSRIRRKVNFHVKISSNHLSKDVVFNRREMVYQ